MHQKRTHGFSLMEALLAIVLVVVVGLGSYAVFDSGVKSSNITDAEDQAVQIANVYTDLASSNLTSANNDVPTLLQNSGRLSSKYFSKDGKTMYNAFGALTFNTPANPYSFEVTIPLGCVKTSVKSSDASITGQFFSKVKDVYSCDENGSKDYSSSTCQANVTDCTTGGSQTSIKLFFNMNY